MTGCESEVLLVKLGGSLITDKAGVESARVDTIQRLARELVEASRGGRRLLLGHGSGSFGHIAAAGTRLADGESVLAGASADGGTAGLSEAAAVQDAAARFHRIVFSELVRAGAAPFSLPPSGFLVGCCGRVAEVAPAAINALSTALSVGFLPVVYGDVVVDPGRGAAVLSTERVLVALVDPLQRAGWRIAGALWLGETDGVADADGRTVDRVAAADRRQALEWAGAARGVDVTGGMKHRLEMAIELAERGIESVILNGAVPGAFRDALEGRPVGTVIEAG